MPSLDQLYATCNSKSYYSRSEGEIYSALSEAGFLVYSKVLKEYSNYFIKFDTTTITLTPGVQVYTLPPDCTQIISISERISTSQSWRQMSNESIQDAITNQFSNYPFGDLYCNYSQSEFRFAGPYLAANNTINQPSISTVGGFTGSGYQCEQITISPQITQTRMVEIAYIAKWISITNSHSYVMLPDECTYAMQNYAIAELLRSNDDSMSATYEAKADKHMSAALTLVRMRDLSTPRQIVPYLG